MSGGGDGPGILMVEADHGPGGGIAEKPGKGS